MTELLRLLDDMLETMYAAPGSASPRRRSACSGAPSWSTSARRARARRCSLINPELV